MEEKKKSTITAAVTALLISLAGLGGSALIDDDQFKNAYFCELTNQTGFFAGGLSGSEFRGYPSTENRKGYKDCKLGKHKNKWVSLKLHAEENNIDLMSFVIQSPSEKELSVGVWGKKFTCPPQQECYEVN